MIDLKTIQAYFKAVPKRYYNYLGALMGVILLLLMIALGVIISKRDGLLQKALKQAKDKALQDYAVSLSIGDASFSGLRTVEFNGVSLTPVHRDTLAKLKHLEVSVKILPLITGKIKLSSVETDQAVLHFIKKDSVSNYDFILKPNKDRQNKSSVEDTIQNLHLGRMAERMLNGVLYKIPDNLRLRNFRLSYIDDSLKQEVYIPRADMEDGTLSSDIEMDQGKALWHLSGDLHPGKKELFFRLTAEKGVVELPLIEKKFGLSVSFDTLETHLKRVEKVKEESLRLGGSWKVSNLRIHHWRIASNDVVVPKANMDALMLIGNNDLTLEKTSRVKLGALELRPFARYRIRPSRTYALGLDIPEVSAQKALDAFPKGLFTSLEGMQVDGKISYAFSLFLDEQAPDSVQLSSEMKEDGFKIKQWGATDFSKINRPFIYAPMEDGKAVRNIIVGPKNPDFTPLNEISANLRNAVLTAEDPSFFSHEGFVPKAIKASIATNFKERAFKRGGSTISMQLVKNVFLNREKTLARKIEEMLIVWLIEHHHIVSKERMFEVYLNIIEWGNNVFGISEAARYYFLKRPDQLDVGESIFLASIVPRPKTGIYRFDSDGIPRSFLRGYYRLIGGLMARRGLIPADSTQSYGFYSVTLRNAVRSEPMEQDSLLSPVMDVEKELEEAKKLLEDLFSTENQANESRD